MYITQASLAAGAAFASFGGFSAAIFYLLGARLSRLGFALMVGFLGMIGAIHGFDIESYLSSAKWLSQLLLSFKLQVILGIGIILGVAIMAGISLRFLEGNLYRAIFHGLFGVILIYFLYISQDLGFIVCSFTIFGYFLLTIFWALPNRPFQALRQLIIKASIHNHLEAMMAIYFYLLGALLVSMFLPKLQALGAMGVLAFADPAARVVGVNLRAPRWSHNPSKTLPGSLGMLGAGFLWLISIGIDPLRSLMAAIAASIFESLPVRVSDNLVVPLICGIMLSS